MREFFRGPQWSSPGARDTWRPILDKARAGWGELEPLSVSEGLRDSALFILSIRELVEATRGAQSQGLRVTVLGESVRVEGYSANVPSAGGTSGVRVAIHRPGLESQWLKVWEDQDDEGIGTLLGFPPCCIEFFSRVWRTERRQDPTPFMEGLEEPGDPKANILFRWLGVRLVPHMPCSFVCKETERQATAMASLARSKGLDDEVTAIEQVLAQPVKYSALHGIGMIETPSFRFAFSTDWSPVLKTFSREAVGGEDLDRTIRVSPSQSANDNGFPSEELMDSSHLVIVQAVGGCESAIDLGCGDGTLLSKLTEGRVGKWTGIELRAPVAHRGSKRYPLVRFVVGRVEEIVTQCPETLGEHDVILLMPGRLIELGEEKARTIRRALKAIGRRLVVYAYGDWLRRFPGLEALTKAAGFPRLGEVYSNGLEVQAAEVIGGTAAIE